jgi:hypothetical protein
MPQGGFSRDFQTATNLRHSIEKLNPYFERKIAKIEEDLILKQDETIEEFITMMRSRNTLLKYLLWTNVVTLVALSFTLGYFL